MQGLDCMELTDCGAPALPIVILAPLGAISLIWNAVRTSQHANMAEAGELCD